MSCEAGFGLFFLVLSAPAETGSPVPQLYNPIPESNDGSKLLVDSEQATASRDLRSDPETVGLQSRRGSIDLGSFDNTGKCYQFPALVGLFFTLNEFLTYCQCVTPVRPTTGSTLPVKRT